MIKQPFQLQQPVLSKNQFINLPSSNNQQVKALQKNLSTSTLHKAPLPPKLFKATKNPLQETTTSTNPIGQNQNENYLQNSGKFENRDPKLENQKQQYYQNEMQLQNQKQYYDKGKEVRHYSVETDISKRNQLLNNQFDAKGIPSLYSISPIGMQILPISMQNKYSNQQNELVNSSGLNTSLYNSGINNSGINNSLLKQVDSSQQSNSIKNEQTINNNIINSNYHQELIQSNKSSNNYEKPLTQSSNMNSKQSQLEESTIRSNSETLTLETRKSSELKSFQIYLNKVTIDPNEQFMIKQNKQNEVLPISNQQDFVNKSNQEKKNSIQLDLKHVFITEGGDSPFTLNNKRAHSLPAKPLILQKSSSNQQFSSYIPISIEKIERKNEEYVRDYQNFNEDIWTRDPLRKTSNFGEKAQDDNQVTGVQVEDYSSIQSIKNQQDRSYHFNSNLGFFGRETRISSIDKYDSNNQQDSMLAMLNQNYNNNVQQNQNQNMMILNSLNSNMTGPDQSQTLSAITKQSELVRRKTSVDEYQRFISSQNSLNIQSVLINNNNSQKQTYFDAPEKYQQHRSSIVQAPQHKQSDGMEEINEEQYSESIVLDKANNQQQNNNINNSYGNRKEMNNMNNTSYDNKQQSKMDQININTNYLDKFQTNMILNQTNNALTQIPTRTTESEKKSYYLQKADEYIKQFKQVKDQLINNNSNQINPFQQNLQNQQIQNNYQMQNNYPILSITSKLTEKSSNQDQTSQIYSEIQQQQKLQINTQNPKNQIVTDQAQTNKFQQAFQQSLKNITESNQSINTERRKKNIDQIVQKCVERTEDLLEKLKTKKQKIKEAKQKTQINTDRDVKSNIEIKNKHSEEIRQSKQKVDEMFNDALNRSRQVVQRHAQNKIQQNSPPVFYQNEKANQKEIKQQEKDQNLLNNYSPQKRIQTDYSVYNRNQDSDCSNGDILKDYNTFGYYSNGAQNRDSVTSSFNQQVYNKLSALEPKIGDYQSRISPVGSREKYHDNNIQNSWGKANNSISFDIQVGNSCKSNNIMSQGNLSPNLQKIELFGSKNQQITTPESERIQLLNKKGIDLQNGFIFDGFIDINGWKQGYGILKNKNDQSLIYEGEWKNNSFHGQGILYNQTPHEIDGYFNYKDFNGLHNYWRVYEGEFDMGKKNGSGTLILTNNEKYSGKFQFDNICGEGVFYRNDHSQQPIVGQWFNNILKKIL